MNKRKLFSVLTSSVLLLSASSKTILVFAENDKEVNSLTHSNEISLVDSFTENADVSDYEVLEDVVVNIDEKTITLRGTVPATYKVVLISDDSEDVVLTKEDHSFVIELNKSEIEENNSVLSLINLEDETTVSEINLVENLQAYEQETTQVETEEIVSEEVEPEVEQEPEVLEVTTKDEDIIEEPIYEVQEFDSFSDEHSFARSSEVEELLHGELAFGTEEIETVQPRMSLFSSRTANNGIYTVKSGDTFNAIASSFNLTVAQLREWNRHVSNINIVPVGTQLAINRTGVERMLSASDKERLYKGGATPVFSTRQGFIDTIAPMAIEVSNQEGRQALWPSLMIAQAAHESAFGMSSLASPPYHNLSGIKGSHNGKSTLMWTWEVYNGSRVNVLAGFRHYPSYSASLQDYANLMRNGLSWSREYYAGTWRSRTNSVWDVLDNQGLAGYATDPNYYAAIRRTINQYDLTKYDTGNYYVRTGTFLGEDFTQLQVNRLKNENKAFSYRIERDENKTPYSYRRIETTREFLGQAGAQRVIDQLQREQGWGASMVATGNSTQRFRVWSGFFNSLPEAQRASEQLSRTSGYSVIIERGEDNKYRLRTGFFNGRDSAVQGLDAMQALGWSARIEGSSDSTPHYIVRTGTFNTPNHVNRAKDYFNANGWGSKEQLDSRNNFYYRIYIEGFNYKAQATSYVNHLSQKYNWGSTSFPVEK